MAQIEESFLDLMVEDFLKLPCQSEGSMAQMYGLTRTEVCDITNSELFKSRVVEARKISAKENVQGELKERIKEKGEVCALNRLLIETDNESDGTPATRIAASRAMLEHTQGAKVGALLAVELSAEKFKMVMGTGTVPVAMPDSVNGPEDLGEGTNG